MSRSINELRLILQQACQRLHLTLSLARQTGVLRLAGAGCRGFPDYFIAVGDVRRERVRFYLGVVSGLVPSLSFGSWLCSCAQPRVHD